MTIRPIQTIAFFAPSPYGEAMKDLEWCENYPMGGSETAAMRMAACFQELGFDVRMLTKGEELDGLNCDVFVSLRRWDVFHAGFRPGRLNYLWCHDDADQKNVSALEDPQVAAKVYGNCEGVMLLSQYHQARWVERLHLPLEKIIMTSNGVPLARFKVDEENLGQRPQWAYYASAPFRGLEVLLLAWPHILKVAPNAQLHILSSMKVYKGQETEEYTDLYEQAKNIPQIVYHGSVGQAQLRQVAQQCRVLAYPSIFPETSCIAAMEAMAAGCAVVSTLTGALAETAWRNPLVPIGEGWLEQWMFEVARLLIDDHYYLNIAKRNLAISRFNDWMGVAFQWLSQFDFDLSTRRV